MKFNCNCEYCLKNTYIWSIDKKIVWIEIPKNASYNIKTIKFNYDSEYPENFERTPLRVETEDSILNFKRAIVVIRNPIERFKSLISHYFIDGSRAKKGFGREWLNLIGVADFNETNIVDIVLDNFDKLSLIKEPHHFNSQYSFLPKNIFDLQTFFIHLNEVPIFFSLNHKINASDSSMIHLNENQLQKIKTLYKDDVDLYEKFFDKL